MYGGIVSKSWLDLLFIIFCFMGTSNYLLLKDLLERTFSAKTFMKFYITLIVTIRMIINKLRFRANI
jgi:hypothetical protein